MGFNSAFNSTFNSAFNSAFKGLKTSQLHKFNQIASYLSETLRYTPEPVAYDCDTQSTGRPLREVTQ